MAIFFPLIRQNLRVVIFLFNTQNLTNATSSSQLLIMMIGLLILEESRLAEWCGGFSFNVIPRRNIMYIFATQKRDVLSMILRRFLNTLMRISWIELKRVRLRKTRHIFL